MTVPSDILRRDADLLDWLERRLEREPNGLALGQGIISTRTPGRGGECLRGGPRSGPRDLYRRIRTAVAAKHGQAVVKVVSYGRGVDSVTNQLKYIGRRGRTSLETRDAGPIKTADEIGAFVADWATDFDTQRNSRNTVHLVISVMAGTDREAAHAAVRDYAAQVFAPNYDYVLVRHNDTDHPHSHVLVKLRGDDGRKLDPRKADLQTWREAYARSARQQGILLDASPRRDRAQGRKGQSMSARKARERGEVTHAEAATAQEVFTDPANQHESEVRAAQRYQAERETYAKLGLALKELASFRSGHGSSAFLDALLEEVHRHAISMQVPESLRGDMRAIMMSDSPPRSVGELLSRYERLRSPTAIRDRTQEDSRAEARPSSSHTREEPDRPR